MYYSAAWQLIEERADDDYDTSAGIDRVMQECWGLRYIDDPVMRTVAAGDSPVKRYYHLTDVQFSTVAIIGTAGKSVAPLVERVGYDAYGKASHRWPGDFDDDGNVNSSDAAIMAAASSPNTPMTSSGYDVRLDLNRDGQIDTNDDAIFSAMGSIAAINAGDISDHSFTGPDNVFGYDGYVFAPELLRYCVRFRWYDPVTGRWMQRDPVGYADTNNLFEYVRGRVLNLLDPKGLEPHKRKAKSRCEDIAKEIERIEKLGKGRMSTSEILDMLKEHYRDDNTPDRYLYTESYNYVDLVHFFAAMKWALRVGVTATNIMGIGVEVIQWLGEWGNCYRSGFSYEDLPSNNAGAQFAFDYHCNERSIADSFRAWCHGEGAKDYDDDPNYTFAWFYRGLPTDDPSNPKPPPAPFMGPPAPPSSPTIRDMPCKRHGRQILD